MAISGAMETGWKQLNGNWYYFQADGSLLRNGTTPDGYKVNKEVQGSQEEPKKDSDKPVEKEKYSAEDNEKDEATETKQTLKVDKE